MADRLTKITTKGGDKGKTSIADGKRLNKFDDRIIAIGEIDELNSSIGVAFAELSDKTNTQPFAAMLLNIQHDLFNLGGELAMPGHEVFQQTSLDELEKLSDQLNEQLPPLKEFILPSGSKSVAYTHLSRAICRRAERQVALLSTKESVRPLLLQYINRLSDFLFILARSLGKLEGQTEIMWQRS